MCNTIYYTTQLHNKSYTHVTQSQVTHVLHSHSDLSYTLCSTYHCTCNTVHYTTQLPVRVTHLLHSHTEIRGTHYLCYTDRHIPRVPQVPEYDGLWKPKHHFATHLAVELLRFGPLRGFWCMSFEGFNKIVKQATELSNYRGEDMFVMEHWILKSAKLLSAMR
jgi:hypothetical protein